MLFAQLAATICFTPNTPKQHNKSVCRCKALTISTLLVTVSMHPAKSLNYAKLANIST